MSTGIRLTQLSQAVAGSQVLGNDVLITDVTHDSRQATPGTLFAALVGAKSDGHDFIAQALNRGAVAITVNAALAGWYGAQGIPALVVHDTRKSLPHIAAAVYGNPSRELQLIGVTGTNGKTTTTLMLDTIFRTRGESTGVIGTLGASILGKPIPQERTTPESTDLQRIFREMCRQGVEHCVMEVSSEGALMERTTCCAFSIGVFTNLTQDHLNTHGTMENYFAQKLRLFTEYPDSEPGTPFTGVVNIDDPYGRRIHAALLERGRPCITYGLDNADAVLTAEVVEASASRIDMTLSYRRPAGSPILLPISLPVGGLFNVYNALGAAGAALAARVPPVVIQNGLENLKPTPGRFETVPTAGTGIDVVVDYAHTPDGLQRVLESAKALQPGRLICVFGCGGDRDTHKRPIMGAIAANLADAVVITSDNPRTEDPDSIVRQIADGVPPEQQSNVEIVVDRHEAIRHAIQDLAHAGDLVVIAGKGHETGQIFASHTVPFDDRQVAAEVIEGCA